MYLLVFVTLIVALTGIYAEVLGLQTRQLYGHQTTVAASFEAWNSTAIGLARFGVTTSSIYPGASGCDLTTAGVLSLPCQNLSSGAVAVQVDGSQTLPSCSNSVTSSCWTPLPPGYQSAVYKFYSVYYQPGAGQNYVLTFMPPATISTSNPAPGLIANASGTLLGITLNDLLTQIKNTGVSPIYYGTVEMVAGQRVLVTPTVSSGTSATSFNYVLPTGYNVPVGSIGMISPL